MKTALLMTVAIIALTASGIGLATHTDITADSKARVPKGEIVVKAGSAKSSAKWNASRPDYEDLHPKKH